MKPKLLLLAWLASACWSVEPPAALKIDMAQHGAKVSAGLYGIFFEENYNKDFFAGYGCNKDRRNCWRRGLRRGKGNNNLGNDFWIKLRFEDNVITGFMSRDGQNWWQMQWGQEVSGYNHNTLGDFLSLLPGIYCNVKGNAKDSHFSYQPLRK